MVVIFKGHLSVQWRYCANCYEEQNAASIDPLQKVAEKWNSSYYQVTHVEDGTAVVWNQAANPSPKITAIVVYGIYQSHFSHY